MAVSGNRVPGVALALMPRKVKMLALVPKGVLAVVGGSHRVTHHAAGQRGGAGRLIWCGAVPEHELAGLSNCLCRLR